jgi:hypothetical protein
VDFLALNPAVAHLILIDTQAAGPRVLTTVQHCLRRAPPFLAPGSGDAPKGVIVRRAVANQIIGATMRAMYEQINTAGALSLPALLPDLAEIVLTPYIGPSRTAEFLASQQKVCV